MMLPVIILQYNLSWMTRNLLDSLSESSNHAIKPIIIDNASKKQELDNLKEWFNQEHGLLPPIIIENDDNVGFIKAVNQGIRLVVEKDWRYFFVFNNDTLVTKDWDIKLMESLQKDKVAIVGPTSTAPDWRSTELGENMIKNKIKYFQLKVPLENWADYLKPLKGIDIEVDFLAFYCAGFNKEAVKEIGLLDEVFGMGLFDDDDYCLRTKQAGYRMLLRRDCYVHHYHRSTWIEHNDNYLKRLETNRKIFMEKHGHDPWKRTGN